MARNSIPHFPARLHQLRERAGMTREQLAEAAGTSPHSIIKLENGQRAPSLELGMRVARALGCTLDELVAEPEGGAARRPRGRPPKAEAERTPPAPPQPPRKRKT
jgi:DNA-binding XRE family transcriptional regulator